MWGASTRLVECLTKNHHAIRVKAEILVEGVVVLVVYGKTIVDPVSLTETALVGGGVAVTRNEVRRECDVTFVDLSAVPGSLTVTDAMDLFSVLRNEVRLWRGYQYHDATPYELMTGTGIEYWPIGTFTIAKAAFDWPRVTLHGYDRLWNLRGRFQKPYSIAKNTPKMEALDKLLRSIIPSGSQDIQLPASEGVTGAITWDQQDSQLTRAHDLALSDGRTLYADPMGTIRADPEDAADPNTAVWTFSPGAYAIHGRPSRELDATDIENVVIATGESDGTVPPVSGRAVDNNPASFSYIGKVPEVVRFYSSPLLRTKGECNLAAQTILNRELGVADQVVIPSVPLPGLESGDVIGVVDPKTRLDAYLIADAFNVPLDHASLMAIDCRTQRI